jgi:hypothetical protein
MTDVHSPCVDSTGTGAPIEEIDTAAKSMAAALFAAFKDYGPGTYIRGESCRASIDGTYDLVVIAKRIMCRSEVVWRASAARTNPERKVSRIRSNAARDTSGSS